MKKGFENGKTFKQLGLDSNREFVVVSDVCNFVFKVGDILKLKRDDGSTCPNFYRVSDNETGHEDLFCLSYAEDSCEFSRGERVMTEDGERIFLTKIEGAFSPYVTVSDRYEKEFNNGDKFHWGWTKECSKLPAVTEMTMEQVEKALGKKVKIIA